MLQELYQIGKALGGNDYTPLFKSKELEEKEKNNKDLKLAVIGFDSNGNYLKCYSEDYDKAKDEKGYYLYRKNAPNGPDFTPTCKFSGNLKKTFNNKILGWFKKYSEDKGLILNIRNEFKEKEKRIFEDLLKTTTFSKKTNYAITIKINSKYVGELDLFRELFQKIYQKKGHTKEGVCVICKRETDISGVFNKKLSKIVPFSTFEKIGFISDFLLDINEYKNIPICPECVEYIDKGKQIINQKLDFSILGIKFWVIPKTIIGNLNKDMLTEVMSTLTHTKKAEREVKSLVSEYDYYPEKIKNDIKEQNLMFIYVFYKGKQAAVKILGISEEVSPSWIQKIFDAEEKSTSSIIFKEEFLKKVLKKNHVGDYRFNNIGAELIKFFPLKSNFGAYKKLFINMVNSILSNKPVSKEMITNRFIGSVREEFKQKDDKNKNYILLWKYRTIDTLKLINFLNELGLIKNMQKVLWDNDEKAFSFLLGVLVQKLLDIQYKERKSAPFYKKIYGLNMTELKLKGLYVDTINKLIEYNKRVYPWLEQLITEKLAKSGNKWTSKDDELSLCFTCGLCLSRGIDKENINKFIMGDF